MPTMTAVQVRAQTGRMAPHPNPEVPERPRPPRQYPAAYKLRVLEEYEQLDKAGKGALLRREGLYTSLISEWRKRRDNARLRDQLARQAKVIEVQGELSALLGRLATSSDAGPSEPAGPPPNPTTGR